MMPADGGNERRSTGPADEGSPLLEAALAYAARGWPVFPCNPKHKAPLLGKDLDGDGKPIPNSGGLKKASTDPEQIRAWWARWPKALVAIATGHPTIDGAGYRMFVVDFDPREDPDTGEVWTLDRLKGEVEQQLGCALPATSAVMTPSDGVHLYFLQADDGPPVTNRGNLPDHVDVRGLGGYVIAPPSVMGPGAVKGQAGLRYRWLRGDALSAIADSPVELLTVLRAPGKAAGSAGRSGADRPARAAGAGAAAPYRSGDDLVDEAIRKYALSGLDAECRAVRSAGSGDRNKQLNESALKVASLVSAGALDSTVARSSLEAAARDNLGRDSDSQLIATLDSGWSAGINNPRDLSEIAAAAKERAARPSRPRAAGRLERSRPARPPAPGPGSTDNGKPSSQGGGSGRHWGGDGAGDEDAGDLTRRCAFLPQTDMGNLERFLERYGRDFIYVEQWGWLAWTGQRWSRDLAVPLLGYAVQKTIRAIQEEAKFVRESGWKIDEAPLFEKDKEQPRGLDFIAKWKGKEPVSFSATIAAWGRTSESAGHIKCIAGLAESRLSARTEDFDADPLLLNVENGTLVFLRPDQGFPASVAIREHRREDRSTKVAAASYDPDAKSPLYDRFLEEVQPAADMRDFLDTWGGYSALGLADAQKMVLFYGEGSNGKGVWVTTHAHILGDYAWAAGIETFIDQGKYRKGSDASPDLAALAGRRMVYANEPEEHSKFSDGLIKALTSDDPIGGVRELLKPPFTLVPTFSNTVMANNKPKIGTDHGIQRRMQLVPWDVIIPDERTDLQLKVKLQGEANGILNRIVKGALDYLTRGLVIPEAVKAATKEYHQENDLLGQFLDRCIAKVPGETIGAEPLQKLFAAWQAWSGNLPATGKPWSTKHLRTQMEKKNFKISKSSTMKWQDIAARYQVHDFTDSEGRPETRDLPPPITFAGEIRKPGEPPPASEPLKPREEDDPGIPF